MRNLTIRALPGLGALLAVTAFATPAEAAPPANAQQARDACVEYLLQTIRAMPEGTYLEAHPDRQTPPGHASPTGTGSAFFPNPEYYSLSYRLPSDTPYTTLADAESAWQNLGWPPARKPPYPNGAIATQAHPADAYTLDTIVGVGPAGTAVTMSCFTTQTFPGGGPTAAPAPASLVQ